MREQRSILHESTGIDFDRRRILQAVGGGVVLAGIGTGSAAAHEHALSSDLVSGEGVHPVFGFAALSSDIDPPVEPDHEIEVRIRPREDREIPEFFYEPTGLYVEPGDTVRFSLVTPHHTITAYHPMQGQTQRVPDGVPAFSSPVLGIGAYWLYTFETEGVYDFHCGPHEPFGHVGRIVAGSATGPGAEPVVGSEAAHGDGHEEPAHDESAARPPLATAAAVLDDPALDPDCIVSRGQVSWDDIAPESKTIVL